MKSSRTFQKEPLPSLPHSPAGPLSGRVRLGPARVRQRGRHCPRVAHAAGALPGRPAPPAGGHRRALPQRRAHLHDVPRPDTAPCAGPARHPPLCPHAAAHARAALASVPCAFYACVFLSEGIRLSAPHLSFSLSHCAPPPPPPPLRPPCAVWDDSLTCQHTLHDPAGSTAVPLCALGVGFSVLTGSTDGVVRVYGFGGGPVSLTTSWKAHEGNVRGLCTSSLNHSLDKS